jgi:cell division septum initiation protein DivIVA
VEVYERLDDLVDLVQDARGVPLSDSCVVNRTIALDLLEAVRALMPASLRDAATILADRDDVLEDASREAESRVAAANEQAGQTVAGAREEADALVASAKAEVERMLAEGQSDAARTVDRARAEAERLVAADSVRLEAERQAKAVGEQSQADAARVRAEADIYVDKRLANLEDTLRAALDQVGRGRRRASAAAPAAPAGRVDGGVYDFAQDPEVAGELVGGRRRSRTT